MSKKQLAVLETKLRSISEVVLRKRRALLREIELLEEAEQEHDDLIEQTIALRVQLSAKELEWVYDTPVYINHELYDSKGRAVIEEKKSAILYSFKNYSHA